MSFVLRDYQEEALEAVTTQLEQGTDRQLIVLPTGAGKRLWDETPVLTPTGWIRLADLEVGDSIVGRDGNPTEILGIHGVGTGLAYRITFNDGTSVVADGDHLWTIRGRKSKNWRTWSTQQILDAGVVEPPSGNRKNGGYKWILPLVSPINHPKRKLQVEPYLMGVLLANGSLTGTSVEFTSNDDYIHEFVANENPTRELVDSTRKVGVRKTRINGLMKRLEKLGLAQVTSRDKFIPEIYKVASVWQRMDLLAGLMDCDGSVQESRRAAYHSYSPHLAQDVATLVRSLGGVAKVTEKLRSDGNTEYETTIWLSNSPFYLPRKSDNYSPSRPWFRAIESIEPVGEHPMRCLHVDADDHLYVVQDYIVTHNTVVFSQIPQRVPGRMLVLAHREELLAQAKDKIELANPDLKVQIEQAENFADASADVVVASVPTLGRKASKRIERFPTNFFTSLVVDEAHHAAAPSYKRVVNYFDTDLLLGVTATPQRGDRVRLIDVFSKIVYFRTIQEMIEEGYLVDMVGYRVATDVDITGVATRSGDYVTKELADAVNIEQRNRIGVEAYSELAAGKRALVFCVDVAHAFDMAQSFRDAGISAGTVVGSTPSDQRRELFEAFSSGKIDVLTNVNVATEGYDEPAVECVDDQTEVLTPTGWAGIDDEITEVVSYNNDSGALEVTPVTGRVEKNSSVAYESRVQGVDFCITPNHRVLAETGRSGSGFDFVEAHELESLGRFRVPVSGEALNCDDELGLTDDELKFIGWFITDGHMYKDRMCIISQSEAKPEHLKELRALLDRLGFDYREYIRPNNRGFENAKPLRSFHIPSGVRYDIKGWNHLRIYMDKSLHPELLRLNRSQFDALYSAMLLGDGHQDTRSSGRTAALMVSDRELLDKLQILALRVGYEVRTRTWETDNGYPMAELRVKEHRHREIKMGDRPESPGMIKVEYEIPKRFWCLENANSTLVIRRNHQISITGNCVMFARPTKSPVTYSQAVGRGLRLNEGKDHCIIIDLCDVTKGKKPVGLPTLLGLPPEFDAQGHKITEVKEKLDELADKSPEEAARCRSVDDISEAWERIDLFRPPPSNDELLEISNLVWMEMGDDQYMLHMNDNERLRIEGDALGVYRVYLKHSNGQEYELTEKSGPCEDMAEAFQRSDAWIQRHRENQITLLDVNAKWRTDPPSEAQLKQLRKHDVPITDDMTKGQASQILDKIFKENPRKPKPVWLQKKIAQQKRAKGGW